jgi:hypothetical protein
MAMIYGADSTSRADTRLTNGYDLYTWVMRMSGVPSFWGRSISGENQTTAEEIEFLHGKGCKLALIFDDITEAAVSKTDGTGDAMRAIEAARSLGVPPDQGVAIFAHVREDWSVNHNWMITYAYALHANGYIPGFIGNTDSSLNFNFGRQCSHYVQFMGDLAHTATAYWGTQPGQEGEPSEWSPYCPSAMQPCNIGLWRNSSCVTYGPLSVNSSYGRDESIIRYMY